MFDIGVLVELLNIGVHLRGVHSQTGLLEAVVMFSMIAFCVVSLNGSAPYGLFPMCHLLLSTIILSIPYVVSDLFRQWYIW